jgi:inner membrane protein
MTPSGYAVADRSLLADHGPMQFEGRPSNVQALREASAIPAVQRLQWFNRGFMRAQVVDGRLVLSDLRMGLEPDYTFNFVVAEQADGQWRPITPEQVRVDYSSPAARADAGRRLAAMWQRIWHAPE